MELKFHNVLFELKATKSFNRTFMELKYMKVGAAGQNISSFNRTFMELKLSYNLAY